MDKEKALTVELSDGECRVMGAIFDFAWKSGAIRDEEAALYAMSVKKKIMDAAKVQAGAVAPAEGGTDVPA